MANHPNRSKRNTTPNTTKGWEDLEMRRVLGLAVMVEGRYEKRRHLRPYKDSDGVYYVRVGRIPSHRYLITTAGHRADGILICTIEPPCTCGARESCDGTDCQAKTNVA